MPDQQRSSLCVCFVPHPVLCVIVHTSRQFSGFICDGPETPNGRGAPTRRPQCDALAAKPAGCGLTTGADTCGWFRRVATTIASSRSSHTAQPGGYAAGSEHTSAHAAGDATTTQPDANATHGVDTHIDEG